MVGRYARASQVGPAGAENHHKEGDVVPVRT
jgi:hypothetical protein